MRNLTIKGKLTASFGIAILMSLLLGIVALTLSNNIINNYEQLIHETLEAERISVDLKFEFAQVRINAFQMLIAPDFDMIQMRAHEMIGRYDRLEYLINGFLQAVVDDTNIPQADRQRLASEMMRAWDIMIEYRRIYTELYQTLMHTRDMSLNVIDPVAAASTGDINNILFAISAEMSAFAESAEIDNLASSNVMIGVIVVMIVASVLIAALMAWYIIKNITRGIESIKQAAQQVAGGDLSISMRTNKRDELGQLSNAVADMVDVFNVMTVQINTLASELEQGNLDYVADESKFVGDYKVAFASIRDGMFSLVEDIFAALEIVNLYGKGNFERTLPQLTGQKAKINDYLNQLQQNLKGISSDINTLAVDVAAGKLNTTIDAHTYEGDWQGVAQALNQLIVSVKAPISEISQVFEGISEGDFSVAMAGDHQGDFANIKQVANSSIATIRSYILEISQTLEKIAGKDMTVAITRHYVGEFYDIKKSISSITEDLGAFITEIHHSSDMVSANANTISTANQTLAGDAGVQQQTVERLNEQVQQLYTQVKNTNESTAATEKLAKTVRDSASVGNDNMGKMLVSMGEISEASSSIAKIIKVIEDIAFQTNLLALNAAVEAARAGEHGRGFAVVAEEVRALAGRSKGAAEETSSIIESSLQKISQGSSVANDTARALSSIVEQINDMSALISQVASATDEQYTSLNHATGSVEQIATLTQSNTNTAQDTAASAQELSSQTSVLKGLLSSFKIN